ncbi:hypothetical protein ACNQKP_01900 [Bdellovibrio bacteriovorus]|uniref:hypothetical protein n=1 Tax=Bdellovibrio bacteriovorus TaxID=959 RepID=UPI003AA84A06
MDSEELGLENLPLDQLNLSFDMWTIVAGLLFSLIGWWLFRQGKKKENKRFRYVGILLMVYPYVVQGAFWNWTVGLILCGYAYYWWD